MQAAAQQAVAEQQAAALRPLPRPPPLRTRWPSSNASPSSRPRACSVTRSSRPPRPSCSVSRRSRHGPGDRRPAAAAVGVALSPVPIIAVILMLGPRRPAPTGRRSGSAGSSAWLSSASSWCWWRAAPTSRLRQSTAVDWSGCCSACSSVSWPSAVAQAAAAGPDPGDAEMDGGDRHVQTRRLVRTRRGAVGRQPEEPRPYLRRRRVDRPGGPERWRHRRGDRGLRGHRVDHRRRPGDLLHGGERPGHRHPSPRSRTSCPRTMR